MSKLPILAGIIILALLALPTCARSADASPKGFVLNARAEVAAFAALVEADLDGALSGARTLAATSDAKSGNWARIKGPLATYAKGVPWAAAVWYGRPDGSYYTLEKGLTDRNVKDRAYFLRLMAGKAVEGDLVVSRSTGRRSVVIAAPVVTSGKVSGVIGVSIAVRELAARLDAQLRLPSNIVFYALDARGRTALHRETELMFEFPTEQGSPTLVNAVKTMLSKPEGVVHYRFRNSRRTAAFRHSPRTGWVFVIGRAVPLVRP